LPGSCWHPYCSDISAAAAVLVVVGITPVFGALAFVVIELPLRLRAQPMVQLQPAD
jgi:hypothetical protein